ncbi:protein MLN51 homolog isoform X1 [Impatiens glandulifera]|uniref:protein MLN51 homolog isoform X1 n=1 Tax=Impatiens glandulifera TaxID=253017 RepID=UPI001FB0785F|nr:protein MLN51 homolog isoform X1 [Impatiens glandulifera]
MATTEEVVYESDPEEETTLSLSMRRREASDEEEGTEDEKENRENNMSRNINSRARIAPDSESDCEGAAADYDDDDEDSDIEEKRDKVVEAKYVEVGDDEFGAPEVAGGESTGKSVEESEDVKELLPLEKEKIKNEPFAVPTAGAFYMHDDRFRDNEGGRHRRTLGGRELWESKDDCKWGHDKFEEMTLQDRRKTRGHYHTHGRNQGSDPRYPRENKYKASNNIDENRGLKNVRGRGPRRYQPSANNKMEVPLIQEKQFVKSTKKDSQNLGRFPTVTPNEEFDPTSIRKQVFASSLNFASPPFYPSCSSNKDIPLTEKRDVKVGTIDHNLRSSVPRQKNLSASDAMEKLYVNDSISQVSGQSSTRKTVSSQTPMVHSSSQPRAQGRAIAPGTPLHQQVHKSSLQKTSTSIDLPVFEEAEILSELSNPKSALVGKRRGSLQVSEKGSFTYSGAQVIGSFENMDGDKNISATPAFLPVMSFGSQHSGMEVSTVGMAFPGYVGQPQHGMGNSKMTWLPVLAGAAVGALGATYGSPYIGADGTYHTHQTTQASPSVTLSKESIANKSIDEWKPSQKNEIVDEEFGQRQRSTRRRVQISCFSHYLLIFFYLFFRARHIISM